MTTLLTRRQTLQSLAFSAIFGGSMLNLVGCGGGGGHHGGGSSTDTANVAVQVPSGFSIPATDLQGGTAYGTGAVTNGAFKAKVSSKGPTFAYLQQKSTGKFVLFGFAGTGQSGVSAMGSATAILALAFGLGGLDPDAARTLVSLIVADPATATLAGIVETRLAADPLALTNGDAAVQAAVSAAVASLTGGGKSLLRDKAVARADIEPLLLIQPQEQGGCSVEQGTAAATIVPTNKVRRPAATYTYLTGYTDGGGTTTLPAAQVFGSVEDLAPTIGFLSSLASLGVHPANAPVSGSPLRLTVHSGSNTVKTTYETVILMASQSQAGEPAFFADAKYAGAVEGWRAKRKELNAHAWIGTILRDTFASVVGGASAWISASTALSLLAKIEAVGAAAEQAVIDVESGKFLEGTYTWLSQAVSEGDIAITTRKAIAKIVLEAEGAGEAAVSAEILTAIGAIAAVVIGTLAAAGTLIGVADLGLGWSDLATSDLADVWTASLLKASVAISPSSETVQGGASVTLTAGTPGVSSTGYKFHWTLSSGGNGNIGDPSGTGGAGRDITTTGTSINLLTSASDPEGTLYSVSVTAISLTDGATLGTATASITTTNIGQVAQLFTVSGADTGEYKGYYFAWAFVRFTPVPGTLSYSAYSTRTPDGFVGGGYVDSLPYTLPDGTKLDNCVCVYGSPGTHDSQYGTPELAAYYIAQFEKQYDGVTWRVIDHH